MIFRKGSPVRCVTARPVEIKVGDVRIDAKMEYDVGSVRLSMLKSSIAIVSFLQVFIPPPV